MDLMVLHGTPSLVGVREACMVIWPEVLEGGECEQ